MFNYKNELYSDEWEYNMNYNGVIYKITVFDDGNQRYAKLKNEWFLFGIWKDKCAIVNKHNPHAIIKSISIKSMGRCQMNT